ncbi:MAG: NHL repeat-containing protein [Thermoanaerobaculia bacterium]
MRSRAAVALLLSLVTTSLLAETRAVVSTVAGIPGIPGFVDGAAGGALFHRPTWLDVDAATGTIYVVDRANNALRRIAGTEVGTLEVSGGWYHPGLVRFNFNGAMAGGIAIEPKSGGCGAGQYAYGMFIASTGAQQIVYVVDYFNQGRGEHAARDDSSPYLGTANVAGHRDGIQPEVLFNQPNGIALSWNYVGRSYDDHVYIADTGNHVIRRIGFRASFEMCPQPYFFDTLAGAPGLAGSSDGLTEARFDSPRGIAAAPDGSVYVADTGNHTIRRITSDGRVETIAGEAGIPGTNDGPSLEAHFNSPTGIAVNAVGELFIADTANSAIRKLTLDGRVVTIAGTPGHGGHADGLGTRALFNGPVGITLAGDSLYVADTSNHAIRKIDFVDIPGRGRPVRR